MADQGELVFTIHKALPDEEEALRSLQAAAIRRFLERVVQNRERLGMSALRGNLSPNEHSPEVVNE